MSTLNQQRAALIRQVDAQIELLKERLRVNHANGLVLVAEITRLERSRFEYLAGVQGYGAVNPRPILLVKTA